MAETGGLRGDDEIARQRQLAAAAEAVPGHGGDQGRPEGADRVPALEAPSVIELDRRATRQLADVRTGRERTLRPAEHDAADRFVAIEALQLHDELVHQLVRQRVELLRPVEEHDGDRLLAFDYDERFRNAFTASCASSPSIDRASQSRAWFTVSCQERSRQKLSCCFA